MRKFLLPALGVMFATPAVVGAIQSQNVPKTLWAFAEPPTLMEGCTDVPEAVALAGELRDRALRIEDYMTTIAAKKAELAEAEASLKTKLSQLTIVRDEIRARNSSHKDAVQSDIDQLVAVYDQMKPAEAAEVLTNLPADFAAEILMRVQPEIGARIIASVEPRQAALLTAQMGARSIRKQ